jgi:hypothetical protein
MSPICDDRGSPHRQPDPNERTHATRQYATFGVRSDRSQKIFVPTSAQVLIATYAILHHADLNGDGVKEFHPGHWETGRLGREYIRIGAGERVSGSYVFTTFGLMTIFRLLLFAYSQILRFNHVSLLSVSSWVE